jgi:hypothetical protein
MILPSPEQFPSGSDMWFVKYVRNLLDGKLNARTNEAASSGDGNK